MLDNGHIKIYRSMNTWGWYTDIPTKVLFLHILLNANWKETEFLGCPIQRGDIVTSYARLAHESGLSVRQVRTALEHLKSTGEVTVNRHSKFSIISVKNYDLYQPIDTIADNQVTVNRQTDDNQVTQDRQHIKKARKQESKKAINRNIAHQIPPTLEMVKEFCRDANINIDCEKFYYNHQQKGWRNIKDWQSAVRYWQRNEKSFSSSAPVEDIRYDTSDNDDLPF